MINYDGIEAPAPDATAAQDHALEIREIAVKDWVDDRVYARNEDGRVIITASKSGAYLDLERWRLFRDAVDAMFQGMP